MGNAWELESKKKPQIVNVSLNHQAFKHHPPPPKKNGTCFSSSQNWSVSNPWDFDSLNPRWKWDLKFATKDAHHAAKVPNCLNPSLPLPVSPSNGVEVRRWVPSARGKTREIKPYSIFWGGYKKYSFIPTDYPPKKKAWNESIIQHISKNTPLWRCVDFSSSFKFSNPAAFAGFSSPGTPGNTANLKQADPRNEIICLPKCRY